MEEEPEAAPHPLSETNMANSHGRPNSNITDFTGTKGYKGNMQKNPVSRFVNYGSLKDGRKQGQVRTALDQTTTSDLHNAYHGMGASDPSGANTPKLTAFGHKGNASRGGDQAPHYTVKMPNGDGSGGTKSFHVYGDGDATEEVGSGPDKHVQRYPGENNYALENAHEYGTGVNHIPKGYQGAVSEPYEAPYPQGHQMGYGGGGEEEEGEEEGEGEEEVGEGEDDPNMMMMHHGMAGGYGGGGGGDEDEMDGTGMDPSHHEMMGEEEDPEYMQGQHGTYM
jgi:hypothetical protein